jgi:HSP20 family protein
MALPRTAPTSWIQGLYFPSQLFKTGGNEYELYEEDEEFVLSVKLPGYDPEEVTVSWDNGVLNIATQHEDESRGERRTFRQRFRFPKEVAADEIFVECTNGILEVRLPIEGVGASGEEIEIEAPSS